MKDTTLFLLCATAIAYADLDGVYNNGCPRDTSIDKLLPHENCNQFYQCFHGGLIARFCPSGLYFNRDLEKCDWNSNNKCTNKRNVDKQSDEKQSDSFEELDTANSSHAVLICSNPDSNGVLIAHENCNEFYKCSYGKPVTVTCAQNLLYNTVYEKCDWPHNVDCSDRIVTSKDHTTVKRNNDDAGYSIEDIDSSNSDPSRANEICSSKRSEGVLVAHEYCNKFYKCSRGKPVTMNCPADLLYNPFNEICDWSRNVYCNDRIIPENDNSNSNAANYQKNNESEENESSDGDDDNSPAVVCAAQNSEGVLVAHENCDQFYKCLDGQPFAFYCPINLLFNSNKKYCDWAKNVDCGERTLDGTNSRNDNENNIPEGKYNDPSQVYAICSAQGFDDVLVAHERCNQFYKCHDGHPIELKCPGNLLYNPEKEYCDWPTYVDCGDRTVPENSESNDNNTDSESRYANNDGEHNDASAICAAENSDGILVPHENCNQFYKCFGGKAIALFCQLNLFYNPQKEYCDWLQNVNCGNRVIPGDNRNSEEDDNNASCQGNADGNIVAHENCSQFYKCVNGQTYPMDCPPGLYFNDLLKICDWPMNVDCGDRLTESQALEKHGVVRRALGVAVLP